MRYRRAFHDIRRLDQHRFGETGQSCSIAHGIVKYLTDANERAIRSVIAHIARRKPASASMRRTMASSVVFSERLSECAGERGEVGGDECTRAFPVEPQRQPATMLGDE